jgi:hypothetical protein
MAIAAHIPALLKFGLPKGDGYDGDRGQLDRLAMLTVNLVMASLRASDTGLPISSFCDDSHAPITQWQRLTALWQMYLATDDWDRVLNSFTLSDSGELKLVSREPSDRERRDFETRIPEPRLRRMVLTGWLTGDHDLRGAAAVWSWALSALPKEGQPAEEKQTEGQPSEAQPAEGQTDSPSTVRAITGAFFRLSPDDKIQTFVSHELERLGGNGEDILELIVGGPIRWSDQVLAEVADYLIRIDMTVRDVSALVQLIRELDKRGSVSVARKLLKLMPANAVAAPTSPADAAAVVSLSRRHQIPDLLSRCTSTGWLTSSLMEWLSIEDIVWVLQSRSLPTEELEILRRRIQADARYRRAVDGAAELLTEELHVTPVAE